jgi:hypothetical protein
VLARSPCEYILKVPKADDPSVNRGRGPGRRVQIELDSVRGMCFSDRAELTADKLYSYFSLVLKMAIKYLPANGDVLDDDDSALCVFCIFLDSLKFTPTHVVILCTSTDVHSIPAILPSELGLRSAMDVGLGSGLWSAQQFGK